MHSLGCFFDSDWGYKQHTESVPGLVLDPADAEVLLSICWNHGGSSVTRVRLIQGSPVANATGEKLRRLYVMC